ncbi:MAG: hypothetical protein ABEI77_00360 [Halorientalis sp.]
MNRTRRLVLALGLALGGVTLGVLVVPELAAGIPIDRLVEQLGGDYVFVAVFGALAVALLLATIAWRGVRGLDQTTPPSPEEVRSVPLFGSDFDAVVDGHTGLRDRLFSDRPATVRDRVRQAAIAAEMESTGCSRATARERLAPAPSPPNRRATPRYVGK